jgi:retron-type reverse transcriptase
LAVAALEDKIAQRATIAVLNSIYEEEFLGFSYGFRPSTMRWTRSLSGSVASG